MRLNRRRFWKSRSDADKEAAYRTLREALVTLSKVLAPILPFLSEALYQNLVRRVDAGAPVSVHLCAYPRVQDELVDEELMGDMEFVRRVVRLGRAARARRNIRVRQPLQRVQVLCRAAQVRALEELGDLVLQELNVMGLEKVEDRGALFGLVLKPNFRALGAKYGRQVAKIQAALKGADAGLAERLQRGERAELDIGGGCVVLEPGDVEVESQPHPWLAVAAEGELVVALDAELTEALIQEGWARDFVHLVQGRRREMGLQVDDRIRLQYRAGARLSNALCAWADYICEETLCICLEGVEGLWGEVADVGGETVRVALQVAG